jgi:hypothetical protein
LVFVFIAKEALLRLSLHAGKLSPWLSPGWSFDAVARLKHHRFLGRRHILNPLQSARFKRRAGRAIEGLSHTSSASLEALTLVERVEIPLCQPCREAGRFSASGQQFKPALSGRRPRTWLVLRFPISKSWLNTDVLCLTDGGRRDSGGIRDAEVEKEDQRLAMEGLGFGGR